MDQSPLEPLENIVVPSQASPTRATRCVDVRGGPLEELTSCSHQSPSYRPRMRSTYLALVLLLSACPAASTSTSQDGGTAGSLELPDVDAGAAAELERALASAPAKMKLMFAAAVLTELEQGSLQILEAVAQCSGQNETG